MTTLAAVLVMPLVYLWAFFYLYVLVMGFYRAHLARKMTGLTYLLALPALCVGYVVDALANLIFATLVFSEWPREMLVTTRLTRHMTGPPGWRRNLAQDICAALLDIFDPTGQHCIGDNNNG